jgi:uncharacterized protein YecE (DUF72 family)
MMKRPASEMQRMPTSSALPSAVAARPHVHVGIGGWIFAPWRDNFYPAGLTQKRELEYASRHVTAIEVNSTFYSPQKPATYAKWRSETPDGFVFSLKAPRYCTDRRVLADAGKSIDAFIAPLAEFGDRLGPIVWQLQANKAFEAADLDAFLALLPRAVNGQALRHALEVRHASFQCADYVQLARRHGCATVFTDTPEYPSSADISADFVYARLRCSEANIATGYSASALDAWAQRIGTWRAGGEPDDLPRVGPTSAAPATPREVFVYFISAAKERNPAAAMALLARLRKDPR